MMLLEGLTEAQERALHLKPAGDLRKEIEVSTQWASLLDPVPPQLAARQVVWEGQPQEVYTIEGLFSPAECEALLAAAESHGFGTTNYAKDYRGNLRLTATDRSLTEAVWRRLEALVPPEVHLQQMVFDKAASQVHPGPPQEWSVCGMNECWRLAKYYPTDRFQAHCDAAFIREQHVEMSMFTVNIYMNEGFGGGSTRFWFRPTNRREPGPCDLEIVPKAGLCLIFRQPPGQAYLHDGEEVRDGLKYLFRSDIMYRRKR